MTRRFNGLATACAFALLACSSSSNPNSPGTQSDASTCSGPSCAADAGGPDDGGPGDTSVPESSDGGEAGTVMRTDLCPSSGPVSGPLPSGVAVVYDGAQSNDSIVQVLANDSVLVWGNQSTIGLVNLATGTTTTAIDHSSDTIDYQLSSFGIDDQYVYFGDSSRQGSVSLGLTKFPLAGGGMPTTLINDPNVGRVVVSDGYVYYEDEVTSGIYQSNIARVPTAGGTPTEILSGVLGGLHGLAVGGGYVYFMGTIGVGSYSNLYLARVPISAQAFGADAGATPADAGVAPAGSELVATTGLDTSAPVTDSTNVYWGDEDMLMAAPLAGGSPVMIGKADAIGGQLAMTAVIQGIAPHGDAIYWSSFGCQALRKTPSSGGATTTIVPSVSALAIAANTSHVYFTPSNGQLLSGPL